MTYLQALYGGQYRDLKANGYDGTKARFNGNLFLTAFIIVLLFLAIAILVTFVPAVNNSLTRMLQKAFGYSSGKTIGKLLAIPLMAVIYFAIINTVGSQQNYERHVAEFNQLPEDVQAQANKKLLVPFFVALGLFVVLAIGSLF
jgi:hypothetical protein